MKKFEESKQNGKKKSFHIQDEHKISLCGVGKMTNVFSGTSVLAFWNSTFSKQNI